MTNFLKGPFKNDEVKENVRVRRRPRERKPIDYDRNYREIQEYFQRRLQRLKVVHTTTTPRGQTIDWIPISSQYPNGMVAEPPPPIDLKHLPPPDPKQPEMFAPSELMDPKVERGPKGTVPILRKKLSALGYTRSLRRYLSKTRNGQQMNSRGMVLPSPEEDGNHRYAFSGRSQLCFGGEGQLSCFDPYTESSDDFSLIQIALSNSDLGFLQTVEAGWQELQDLTGDWLPHLFTFYTTNGYKDQDDDVGGYNTDVDGWVQHDDTIFPGTTFTPFSDRGGNQFKMTIKYQLFQDNWWLSCQGRWIGFYPARLFMGNQSVFSTLGDHADRIAFYGEIFDSDDVEGRTKTDMGSGNWPNSGWTWSAYMHNLLVQTSRTGAMANYDGSPQLFVSDPDMYDIETHFNSETTWGSYVYLGGPGAG